MLTALLAMGATHPARATETMCFRLEEEAASGCLSGATTLTASADTPFTVRAVYDPQGGQNTPGATVDFTYPASLGAPTCDSTGSALPEFIAPTVDTTQRRVKATYFNFSATASGKASLLKCAFPATAAGTSGQFTWNPREVGDGEAGVLDANYEILAGLALPAGALEVVTPPPPGGEDPPTGDISLSIDLCNGKANCTTVELKTDAEVSGSLGVGFDVVNASDPNLSCLKASSQRQAAALNLSLTLPVDFDLQKCPGDTLVNVVVTNIPSGAGIPHNKETHSFPCRKNVRLDALSAENTLSCLLYGPGRSGDAHRDGVVDMKDLGVIKGAFNTATGASGFNANADFNGDGKVDMKDLGIIKQYYGASF